MGPMELAGAPDQGAGLEQAVARGQELMVPSGASRPKEPMGLWEIMGPLELDGASGKEPIGHMEQTGAPDQEPMGGFFGGHRAL